MSLRYHWLGNTQHKKGYYSTTCTCNNTGSTCMGYLKKFLFLLIIIIKLIANWWDGKGTVKPQCEPRAEHGGIHGNPGSSNHLARSYWQSQWRYLPPHITIATAKADCTLLLLTNNQLQLTLFKMDSVRTGSSCPS